MDNPKIIAMVINDIPILFFRISSPSFTLVSWNNTSNPEAITKIVQNRPIKTNIVMYPKELIIDSDVKLLSGFKKRIALIAGLIIEDNINAPEMTIPV